MTTKAKEQPLNVEMGKREADAYMRRRDRMDRIARERERNAPAGGDVPQDQLQRWIDDTFPAGFPREWFR